MQSVSSFKCRCCAAADCTDTERSSGKPGLLCKPSRAVHGIQHLPHPALGAFGTPMVEESGPRGHICPHCRQGQPCSHLTTSGIFTGLLCNNHVSCAGTYTPICLLALRDSIGKKLLIAVWTGACVGVAQSLFWVRAPKALATLLYLGLGWLGARYAKVTPNPDAQLVV